MRPREGLLLFALARTVAGAPADVVKLAIPDCEGVSGAQIEKLVALELPSSVAIADDAEAQATLHASLQCAGGHAVITVEDSTRARPLVLHLDLADTRPEARPRFLALSIAELIATSRLERNPAPARATVAPPARAPLPKRREPASSLWLSGGLVRAYEPGVWEPALAIGGAHDFGPIALTFDVAFDWGDPETARATVEARALSLSIAPAFRLVIDRFVVRLGAGLRAGYVWLAAEPREPGVIGRTLSGVVLLPVAQGSLDFRFSEPVFVRFALEGGYTARTVRGLDVDRGALVEAAGLRAAALFGFGWSF